MGLLCLYGLKDIGVFFEYPGALLPLFSMRTLVRKQWI